MRLPFNVDQLDSRPIIYELRSWRNTPNIRISRLMDPILDLISMETANEVSDKAETNLLRVFHYNMMSRREFNNPDFDRLVTFVAEFIEMLVLTRRIHDPEQDLINNIADAVALHSCKQVMDFPELEDLCARSGDARMMRALDTNVGRYQQIVRDLEAIHNENQQDIRGGLSGRQDFRSQYAGSSGGRDIGGRGYRSERDTLRNVSARDTGGEYATDVRTFKRDEMYGTDRPTQRRIMESSRGYIERQAPVQQTGDYRFVPQPVKTFRNDEPVNNDGLFRPQVSEYEARPPAPQPELPAPPPPPAESMVSAPVPATVTPGRCVEPIPAFKGILGSFPILNEQTMNIDEHSSVYDLNEVDTDSVKKEVIRTLSLAQCLMEDGSPSETSSGNIIVDENAGVYSDVHAMAAFISDDATMEIIKTSGENKTGERKIFHTFGLIDNAMTGFTQLNDVRALLGKTITFKELIQSLRHAKEVTSKCTPEVAYASDIRGAVDMYDAVLTREVNAYFRDVLKLSDGDATSSIVEDFDDILTQVQRSGKDDLISAMLMFFTQLNGNLQEALLPEYNVANSIKESQEIDDTVNGFCVMPMSYIVTHLPFTSKELGFDVQTSKAIMATSGDNFIRGALDISQLQQLGKLENSFRLMVTRDRKIMRVYTYPGRKDVIILSAYK